jgi:hypothetical protein
MEFATVGIVLALMRMLLSEQSLESASKKYPAQKNSN